MPLTDVLFDRALPGARLARALTRRTATTATAAAAAVLMISAAATYALRAALDRPGVTSISAPAYDPHELIVGYAGSASRLIAEIDARTSIHVTLSKHPELTPHEQLLQLPAGVNPPQAATRIVRLPGVTTALPDYIAHLAGQWYPDDPGRAGQIHGWEKLQWNFLPRAGVNAPEAWANLLADHRPGAQGVLIAIVDTGIAFRKWRTFKKSPDFRGSRFIAPCDLVVGTIRNGGCNDPYALDREGHGTFVAGTIAEATNNNYGLTGLAYHATLLPVRVLDSQGNGDSSTIAAGIRYAVVHGAKVINLSIEFSPGTTRGQIPDVASAITFAHNRGVVVVGAAGNDEGSSLDYPAALPDVISVGATTRDRCLALYSNTGRGLNLVAPGGGDDVASAPGSRCFPSRNLPDIYQMTFGDSAHPAAFGFPGGWFGTSMATPAVSAAAAMVIASRVLGPHPTPTQILNRLEATADPLGTGRPNNPYGYGLLNIGAATRKGGPLVPPTKPYALAGASTGTVVR
ncbi:MAG: S8 family serine peptidase [Acidobacteriota bacterium]|nr:S8 family serine peptidase [Acidobacteriota bacterium]